MKCKSHGHLLIGLWLSLDSPHSVRLLETVYLYVNFDTKYFKGNVFRILHLKSHTVNLSIFHNHYQLRTKARGDSKNNHIIVYLMKRSCIKWRARSHVADMVMLKMTLWKQGLLYRKFQAFCPCIAFLFLMSSCVYNLHDKNVIVKQKINCDLET